MKNKSPDAHIYHFTHVNNLSKLLKNGALLSNNEMEKRDITYTSSAYSSIQEQRHVFSVPIEPNGTLHDYVPFYFTSLSPMLFAIKTGNIAGVSMQDVIFFQSTARNVQNAGEEFVFTDGHAIMALSDYYNDLERLSGLPWRAINAKYWNDIPDGKRLRQSEFLVYKQFNWELVQTIGVFNEAIKTYVCELIAAQHYKPTVSIKSEWYF